MLNITDALKTIYKNDTIPTVSRNVRKDLEIYFPALNLTIRTDQIVDDSFSLDESLFSDSDIVIGSCESSQIKFTLADVTAKLKGQEFTIVQKIGANTVPLGTYKVDSAKEQDNLRFKDVIAYDNIKKFDVDVASWYNSLIFPLTLKTFRNLLCNYVGVEYEDSNLLNDEMQVTKTIDPKTLKGMQVLIACEEINGAYGHIGRSGTLQHITLNNTVKETYVQPTAIEMHFEEYTVKAIHAIQVHQEEGDVGAIAVTEHEEVIDTQTGTLIHSVKSDDATAKITRIEGASYQEVTVQGKNLLKNTDNPTNFDYLVDSTLATIYSDPIKGNVFEQSTTATTEKFIYSSRTQQIKKSTNYTLSADIWINDFVKNIDLFWLSDTETNKKSGTLFVNVAHKFLTSLEKNKWQRIIWTFTTKADDYTGFIRFDNNGSFASGSEAILRVTNVILEEGSVATPYEPFIPNSPSPDYPSPITTAENFNITASNGVDSNSINVAQKLGSLSNGVKDTIEVVDGVLNEVQRIGLTVFDGSADENWRIVTNNRFAIPIPDLKPLPSNAYSTYLGYNNIISTHFKPLEDSIANMSNHDNVITVWNSYPATAYVRITKVADGDLIGFKSGLALNPMTVQYELETPIYTPITDLSLTSYEGLTDISTTANPQVNITAKFLDSLSNTYAIQGNFLVYGKSAQELAIIANNILATVGGKPYRQFTAETIGLPYMEVGDYVSFPQNDTVNTFILKRSLRGIQALRDSLEANGSEYIKVESGVNEEIIQLKGKAAVLKRTVEELSNTITDVEEGLTNEIQQTADEINLRITQVEKIYDSAAESTQGEGIPTLENYPAMNWTDEVYPGTDQYPSETETWTYSPTTYDKHLGTVYYDNANQKAYRFTLIDGVYQFKEITDALTATIINKISSLEMTTDSIETNVTAIETRVNNDLYTKTETQSLVTQTATGITQTVSSTYETKSNASATKSTLQSQITQTATEIRQEVSNSNNNLQAQINVQAGQIELKVSSAGLISAINVTPGTIKIQGNKIDLVTDTVEIVGKLYLNIDDNDTALYAVSPDGTSGVLSYQNTTTEIPGGSQTYKAVVLGDSSANTRVVGRNIALRSNENVTIRGDSSVAVYGESSVRLGVMASNGAFSSVRLDSSFAFRPDVSGFSLGSSSLPWDIGRITTVYVSSLRHTGTLGFFGTTPRSKTTVSDLSTSATLAQIITKINDLLNALQGYGLV